MQVSVKKKSSPDVESFVDVSTPLPNLVEGREVPVVAAQVATRGVVADTRGVAADTRGVVADTRGVAADPKGVEKVGVTNGIKEADRVEAEKVMPRATPKRPSILNLGELLSDNNNMSTATTDGQSVGGTKDIKPTVDSQSGEKLEAARGAIMNFLAEWRPRFIAVFEPMIINANTINIVVPTSELRDEIMRGKTEFLTRVVALSGVSGVVELTIEVNEAVKSYKPIKLEDRIAYIMGLNPLIVDLKDALDLDVEG